MITEVATLLELIKKINIDLENMFHSKADLIKKLHQIQSTCSHNFVVKYSPMAGPHCYEPQWKRTCENCAFEQTTTSYSKPQIDVKDCIPVW